MKFGQALSVFEAALPEEIAAPYRQALTKLQEAAPPLPVASVHKVLAEQLGPDWRDLFVEFDDIPAAAASIGQVHRARVARAGVRRVGRSEQPRRGGQDPVSGGRRRPARRPQAALPAGRDVPGHPARPGRQAAAGRAARTDHRGVGLRVGGRVAAHLRRRVRRRPGDLHPGGGRASPRVLVTEWVDGHPAGRHHPRGHRGGARRGRPVDGHPALLRAAAGRAAARRPAPGQLPAAARRPARGDRLRRGGPDARRAPRSRSAGSPAWRCAATPTRSWRGCGAEGFIGRPRRSTPRRCSTSSARCWNRSRRRSSASPGPGCGPRRAGWPARAPPRTS